MRKLACVCFLCAVMLNSLNLWSALPGANPSSINQPNTNPFPKAPPQKEPPIHHPRMPLPPKPSKEAGPPFTLPGIVGLKEGRWAGSDNLYNLNPDISIYVEVVLPEDQKIEVHENEIKARIQELFTKGNIKFVGLHEPGEPPLPFFHVLVMINSLDQFMTAYCGCRLFEAVDLKRVVLEQGITFQAVTWEKQDLILASKKDFLPLLNRTIDDLAGAFVNRFEYFQNLRLQHQSNR
jgi:hypothetical protein